MKTLSVDIVDPLIEDTIAAAVSRCLSKSPSTLEATTSDSRGSSTSLSPSIESSEDENACNCPKEDKKRQERNAALQYAFFASDTGYGGSISASNTDSSSSHARLSGTGTLSSESVVSGDSYELPHFMTDIGTSISTTPNNLIWSSETWSWIESSSLNTDTMEATLQMYSWLETSPPIPQKHVHFGPVGSTERKRHVVMAKPSDMADPYDEWNDRYTRTALGLLDMDDIAPCTRENPCLMDKIFIQENKQRTARSKRKLATQHRGRKKLLN